jgi:hypothetical protein
VNIGVPCSIFEYSREYIIPNLGCYTVATLIVLVMMSKMISFHFLEMCWSTNRGMMKEIMRTVITYISSPGTSDESMGKGWHER